MTNITITRLQGEKIIPYINELAKLRIQVFREFPYLYEGNFAYEHEYLQTYCSCPESILVLVKDGDNVVGGSTAIPLVHEVQEIQEPFLKHHFDLKKIFYFGESVLLAEYRGQGLGYRFFQEREAAARLHPGCDTTAFCAVQRPVNHPKRPANYQPLDSFWQKLGYSEHPELITHFAWPEIGEQESTSKPMAFWLKSPL